MNELEREEYFYEREERRRVEDEMNRMINTKSITPSRESAIADIKRKKAEKAQIEAEAEFNPRNENSGSEYNDQHGVSDEESVNSGDDARDLDEHPMMDSREEEITIQDIEKVRLSRDTLERWVDQVYFESTVEGCFVKTTVATNRDEQRYIICQISGLKNDPSNVYKLGKKQTSMLLKLKYGSSMKSLAMTYVSNTPFTETEFIEWKRTLSRNNIPMMNRSELIIPERKIKEANGYQYKNEEIFYMLTKARQERLDNPYSNINIALEFNQVTGSIDFYEKHYEKLKQDKTEKVEKKVKEAQVRKAEEMLAMLNQQKETLEKLKKTRYNTVPNEDAMQRFNQTGRLMQQEIDSKSSAKENEAKGEFNPFSRRNIKPETIWNTKLENKKIVSTENDDNYISPQKPIKTEEHQKDNIDEIRRNELLKMHKEAKLEITIEENMEISEPTIMIENIYNIKLGGGKKDAKSNNEKINNTLSFQEWKEKYYQKN